MAQKYLFGWTIPRPDNEDLTAIAQGHFDFAEFNSRWQEVSSYFLGYTLCLAVGVLFAIIMPIVGCCFCCCRCCGRCGGKRKLHDPKRAKCKRTSYCTVLLIINTVCLAGVICAFVTNDILHQKLDNKDKMGPLGNVDKAVASLDNYVNNTVKFLEKNILKTYEAATEEITISINESAITAVKKVLDIVNASVFIDQTKDLAKKTDIVLDDLVNIRDTLKELKTNGDTLSTNLTQLKNEIDQFCQPPNNGKCTGLDTDKYKTEADFSKLSELSTEIDNVKDSLNITQYINQVEGKIDQVKSNVTDKISDSIIKATNTMRDVRKDVTNGIDLCKGKIQDATKPVFDFQGSLESEQSEISKYGNYVWYAGLGISCLLLLIVLFYYLGVLFGMCGERPGRGAACCNTGVGGNFLMAGVAFSFVFSWILMIICLILFLAGGFAYTEACRYFVTHEPADLQPFENLVFQNLDFTKNLFNDSNAKFSIVQTLKNCEENQAIYTALQLDSFLNINNYLNISSLYKQIDNIAKSNVDFNNITILIPELRQQIEEFGNAGLDKIDYDSFEAEINKNLTAIDLIELAKKLENKAASETGQFKQQLEEFAAKLRRMDKELVTPMKKDVTNLKGNLTHLKENSNVKPETEALVKGLESAEKKFNSEGVTEVNTMLSEVVNNIKNTLGNKTTDIKTMIKKDAGKCRPVYDSIYLMTDAFCVVVLYPMNGFWFSMGWCLFFFIPSIIFAVKLSTLYHREEEYVEEKGFDDPNFSMYAGPNPDTIPLTSSTGPQHGNGYGAHNTGYRDDGYRGKSNGYPTHAEGPPGYNDGYRGRPAPRLEANDTSIGDGVPYYYYPPPNETPLPAYSPQKF
ncbi:hypothetical protein LOTGIDRAFT_156479 [Lottia gigantea]|uniref:Prominin-like protein n=1 Tax=Lottia gigantea TaxID=225164 RepID=V4BDS2_LOTGI|nr:hypothetical protein LOTGIDRAFT_156479 [Lottia gigantea]ESP03882.1 hypothetical protein LOTGIDRAFT_156479 [Lottia gigantea]